jgi:hypothetical protein
MFSLTKELATPHGFQQKLSNRVDRALDLLPHIGRRILFDRVVARAHRQTVLRYPFWADSLFDAHFLATHAKPLLTPLYEQGRWPTAQELARAWYAQFGRADGEKTVARSPEAITVMSAFLDVLRAEWQA